MAKRAVNKYGLDKVFRLMDSVMPGEKIPDFICEGFMGDNEIILKPEDFLGENTLFLFYPSDFGHEGEQFLDLVANLALEPEYLGFKMVAISTDSLEVMLIFILFFLFLGMFY